MIPTTNILTNDDEAMLKRLSLLAFRKVAPLRLGVHRAAMDNGSTEFSEHRAYGPGDSIRNLDWRILAKSRKPYVKKFHDPSSLASLMMLDCSRSMAFESGGITRFDYARRVVMFLTRLLLAQDDPTGLLLCADKASGMSQDGPQVPMSSNGSQVLQFQEALLGASANGPTAVVGSLQRLAIQKHRPLQLIVITDGFFDLSGLGKVARQLSSQRHHLMVLQILAPEEKSLQIEGGIRFRCMETDQMLNTTADEIRGEYQSRLSLHQNRLKTILRRVKGGLEELNMQRSVGLTVSDLIQRRTSTAGRRG